MTDADGKPTDAQDGSSTGAVRPAETTTEKAPPVDKLVDTHHTATIRGQDLSYTVTAGTVVLREETGDRDKESEGEKAKATFFFVAYVKDGSDVARRPVTFSFNGGPGSSSVWLHLGLLAPVRVQMGPGGEQPPPPYRLQENQHSLLDATDLVFIDPVSTGYSRAVEGQKPKEFHGFQRDLETVGDFVRLYCTRYGRWPSPKFLIGESYGTTRAAGLSGYLQERHGLFLNGIMLVSTVLDFSTIRFDVGNDLPYVLYLPTYAATAHYHGRARTRRSLDAHLRLAESFAMDVYAPALLKGAALPPRERRAVVEGLSRLTGLASDYVDRADLRIEIHRFTKELLRGQGRTVGRLDSRFRGIDRDGAGEVPEHDPSLTNIVGPYTACLYDYVRRDLGYESDLPYEILNPKVWPWSYESHQNRYLNVAETLRKTMSANPYLEVFIATGTYDLATPYLATDHTVRHLGLDPTLRAQITTARYDAGHMMYIDEPSLERLAADLHAFVRRASRVD